MPPKKKQNDDEVFRSDEDLCQEVEAATNEPMQILETTSDGNCFFAALAQAEYGAMRKPDFTRVRREIVEYQRNHPAVMQHVMMTMDVFDNSPDSEWNEYLDNMSQNRVWGGQEEITAAVHLYQRPIHILFEQEGAATQRYDPPAGTPVDPRGPIFLSYSGDHYRIFVPESYEPPARGRRRVAKRQADAPPPTGGRRSKRQKKAAPPPPPPDPSSSPSVPTSPVGPPSSKNNDPVEKQAEAITAVPMKVRETPKNDSDSFFYSIALLVYGDFRRYEDVRAEICEWMEKNYNNNDIRGIMRRLEGIDPQGEDRTPWEDYLVEVGDNRPAGDPEIYAAAHRYLRTIHIVANKDGYPLVRDPPPVRAGEDQEERNKEPLVLVFRPVGSSSAEAEEEAEATTEFYAPMVYDLEKKVEKERTKEKAKEKEMREKAEKAKKDKAKKDNEEKEKERKEQEKKEQEKKEQMKRKREQKIAASERNGSQDRIIERGPMKSKNGKIIRNTGKRLPRSQGYYFERHNEDGETWTEYRSYIQIYNEGSENDRILCKAYDKADPPKKQVAKRCYTRYEQDQLAEERRKQLGRAWKDQQDEAKEAQGSRKKRRTS